MPRRSNLRSANSVANAATPTRLNIPSCLKNADRVNGTFVYFYDRGVLDEPISHEDFLQKVRDLAEDHGEILGRRATPWFEVALSRLRKNRFITYLPYRDDVLKFKVTPIFLTILRGAHEHRTTFRTAFNEMSDFRRFRAMCGYLRLRFERNERALTRKEYDILNIDLEHKNSELEDQRAEAEAKNKALEYLVQQCKDRIAGMEGILKKHNIPTGNSQRMASPAPTELVMEPQSDDSDSMYVDDVPQMAGPSRMHLPQTPVRRSSTLNNPRAYPTPESAPRALSQSSRDDSPHTDIPTQSISTPAADDSEDSSFYVDVDDRMCVDDEPCAQPATSGAELEWTSKLLIETLEEQVQELEAKCNLLMKEDEKRKTEHDDLNHTVADYRQRETVLRTIAFFWTEGYRREKREHAEAEANLKRAEKKCKELEQDIDDVKKKHQEWRKGLDRYLETEP